MTDWVDSSFYERFADRWAEHARSVEETTRRVVGGHAEAGGHCEHLAGLVHDLAGEAGLLGMGRLSWLARRLSHALRGLGGVPAEQETELRGILTELMEGAVRAGRRAEDGGVLDTVKPRLERLVSVFESLRESRS